MLAGVNLHRAAALELPHGSRHSPGSHAEFPLQVTDAGLIVTTSSASLALAVARAPSRPTLRKSNPASLCSQAPGAVFFANQC